MVNRKWWATVVLTAALFVAGCSEQQEQQTSKAQQPVVTIDNEGVTTAYEQAPEKAITINQHVTEIMLALGLEDSMVGTAYLDDKIYAPLQQAYEQVPVLAETYPTKEQIIATEADFIYGGWASAFNEKNVASREELTSLGIDSYLQASSVKIAPSLDDVQQDILNIAAIFQVAERGEQVVAEMDADIAAIQQQLPQVEKPLDVFVFDSGDTEVMTATQNFMTTLITMAGGHNVFGDIEDNWATVSKEEVVNRTPQVIVIIDYGSTTVDQKKEFLKADPALSQLEAVQQERFVVLPLSAASEGVRVAEAVEILAQGFYPEVFQE